MSRISTLSAGYKSNPNKIRSSNTRPHVVNDSLPKMDANELANRIKIWQFRKKIR